MKITKDNFSYKIYRWSWYFSKKLFNWDSSIYLEDAPSNTNLCTFMRSVFIWTPIYLLLLMSTVGFMIFSIFIYPYMLGGFAGYLHSYVVPMIFLIFFIGILVILRFIAIKIKKRNKVPKNNKITFSFLVYEYIKAAKLKICPMIRFENND